MEHIKIEKDGSMSIPAPGNMKITVEMTEGLFDYLRYPGFAHIYK